MHPWLRLRWIIWGTLFVFLLQIVLGPHYAPPLRQFAKRVRLPIQHRMQDAPPTKTRSRVLPDLLSERVRMATWNPSVLQTETMTASGNFNFRRLQVAAAAVYPLDKMKIALPRRLRILADVTQALRRTRSSRQNPQTAGQLGSKRDATASGNNDAGTRKPATMDLRSDSIAQAIIRFQRRRRQQVATKPRPV
ncbi:hypothetical protein R3P38DRAFT_2786464 [Favolaschia claudopus]|uniref:Uncharacterized protein n=1 Tax=Favolaschia claudopus TaxID=2862362 RepID=A0AAW0AVE9_9AGAR